MKVEVDQDYCCGQEVIKKKVLDVESKENYLIFICEYCKNTFRLSEKNCISFKKK